MIVWYREWLTSAIASLGPTALDDIQKTFRFYYQCDDIWVCQNGGWSLKYSVVKNMGPGVEAPYKAQLLGSK
jgi:hypothetical protein